MICRGSICKCSFFNIHKPICSQSDVTLIFNQSHERRSLHWRLRGAWLISALLRGNSYLVNRIYLRIALCAFVNLCLCICESLSVCICNYWDWSDPILLKQHCAFSHTVYFHPKSRTHKKVCPRSRAALFQRCGVRVEADRRGALWGRRIAEEIQDYPAFRQREGFNWLKPERLELRDGLYTLPELDEWRGHRWAGVLAAGVRWSATLRQTHTHMQTGKKTREQTRRRNELNTRKHQETPGQRETHRQSFVSELQSIISHCLRVINVIKNVFIWKMYVVVYINIFFFFFFFSLFYINFLIYFDFNLG